MKRTAAFCLLAALLILSLFACGKKTDAASVSVTTDPVRSDRATTEAVSTEPETTVSLNAESPGTTDAPQTTATVQQTAAPWTTDGWEEVAASLAGTDAENRSILIALDESETDGTGKRDPRLLKGPDEVDDATPAVEREIYSRNLAACRRLGITVRYAYWDDPCGAQANRIKTLVGSGDASAPDLFVSPLTDLWNAAFDGCFADILSSSGSWLELGTNGWLSDYMTSLSLTRDRAYILAGDAFPDLYRGAVVLPFNRSMADAEADRLLPCISPDGALAAGETFSTRFFDFIEAGKWTYGALAALSEAIFTDIGEAAERDDFDDLLGIACDAASPTTAYAFLASCEANPIAESTDAATGRLRLAYLSDGGTLGQLFDAVSGLFSGTGTLATAGGATGENGEYGTLDLRRKFVSGTMLFAGTVSLGSLCDDEYLKMTDDLSVAPLPKLREGDRYVTPVLPDADAGAINRNTAAFPAVTAFLQFCTENSETVRDGYLSVLTRACKTGNVPLLALICSAMVSGREAMIDAVVSGDGAPAWSKLLATDGFRMTSADFTAEYAAAVAVKEERLNALLDLWYACPKAAP